MYSLLVHSMHVKKISSCMKWRRKNLSCLRLQALNAVRLELSMLHLLSGIPKQLQLIPPSSNFPFSHRLSVSDVEGTAILKGGWSEHLTSFPNTALPLPQDPIDCCLFEKKIGHSVWSEVRVDESSLRTAWERSFVSGHDLWLQSAKQGFN